jgi:hypothetical protein
MAGNLVVGGFPAEYRIGKKRTVDVGTSTLPGFERQRFSLDIGSNINHIE